MTLKVTSPTRLLRKLQFNSQDTKLLLHNAPEEQLRKINTFVLDHFSLKRHSLFSHTSISLL